MNDTVDNCNVQINTLRDSAPDSGFEKKKTKTKTIWIQKLLFGMG